MNSDIQGINILRAIDLSNIVRAVGGFSPVNDLIPGIPMNSEQCVLARTFNCECYVEPVILVVPGAATGGHRDISSSYPDEIFPYIKEIVEEATSTRIDDIFDSINLVKTYCWFVGFSEPQYANALAGELNQVVFRKGKSFCVLLPAEVGFIASRFDDDALDSEYYIYDDHDDEY